MGAVVGYKYAFGIHMGISRGPVDELIEIKVGDKTAWRGSIKTNGTTAINEPELFGGESGEGGVDGTLTTMFGGPTQTAPTQLSTVLKTPMPGFRRRFTVFFDGIISMMNPYPKPWKFRVRRALEGWDGDPWLPQYAVVPLVREVSVGETAGSSTVEDLRISEPVNAVAVAGNEYPPQFTLTIDPDGPLVAFHGVYLKVQESTGGA